MKNCITIFCVAISFIACGSADRDHSFDAKAEAYKPENLEAIGNMVYAKNHLNFDDYSFAFYQGTEKEINDICPAEYGVFGCSFADPNEVFLREDKKDDCWFIAHELTHLALKEATGDGHADHNDPQFQELFDICIELGAL